MSEVRDSIALKPHGGQAKRVWWTASRVGAWGVCGFGVAGRGGEDLWVSSGTHLLRLSSEIYPAGHFCPRVGGYERITRCCTPNLRVRHPSAQGQDDAKLRQSCPGSLPRITAERVIVPRDAHPHLEQLVV